VTLIDLDTHAVKAGRRRLPRHVRPRVTVIGHDVTHGAADTIAAAAGRADVPVLPVIPESPLPGAPYDLVIGDPDPLDRRAAADLSPGRTGGARPRSAGLVARAPTDRVLGAHPRAREAQPRSCAATRRPGAWTAPQRSTLGVEGVRNPDR
jgi:hypothetical protein